MYTLYKNNDWGLLYIRFTNVYYKQVFSVKSRLLLNCAA